MTGASNRGWSGPDEPPQSDLKPGFVWNNGYGEQVWSGEEWLPGDTEIKQCPVCPELFFIVQIETTWPDGISGQVARQVSAQAQREQNRMVDVAIEAHLATHPPAEWAPALMHWRNLAGLLEAKMAMLERASMGTK
jgi:hypothetical protein